jgi:cytochrome c biogenesis protein CcmG/thiol:disulfide interchange protein DsbE
MMAEDVTQQEQYKGHPRRWGVYIVWLIVLGLLFVLGFGLIRSRQGTVAVGEEVPDFKLTTFDGDEIDILELRDKVVVINFWASWCSPCEQEALELEEAYRAFKDEGVIFLGVDYVDTEPEALAYLKKFDITYPNGPDLGTRISQAFRIRGVPETFIVGRGGRLVDVMIGPYASFQEIEEAVLDALGR